MIQMVQVIQFETKNTVKNPLNVSNNKHIKWNKFAFVGIHSPCPTNTNGTEIDVNNIDINDTLDGALFDIN